MKKNRKIFVMASLLISCKALSQSPAKGAWLSVQLPLQISSKWQIQNDFNYRTLGSSVASLQHLHRLGLKFNISKNWSSAMGGAFSFTRTSFSKQHDEFAKEFRLWQELNYKSTSSAKLQAQLRVRTEERFFAATSSKAAFHAFRYRIKPQLLKTFSSTWSLYIADEYMQQHTNNSWSFNQNRLIVNAVYQVNKLTQLQAGYMRLQWPAHSSQNILMLSFQKTISLHDKHQ